MMNQELVEIGALGKPHGVKGELKLSVEPEFILDMLDMDACFIAEGGQKIPYFIEYFRGDEAQIIKFEEVDTREAANALKNKPLFVKANLLSRLPMEETTDDDLEMGYLKGFTLIDVELGKLGEILAIEAYPQQEVALINYQGNEYLIPLVDAFIREEDQTKKTLTVELPEGLID